MPIGFRRNRGLAAAVVGLALVAAACGGDDDDADGTTAPRRPRPRRPAAPAATAAPTLRRPRPPTAPAPTARRRRRHGRHDADDAGGEPVTLRLGYFPNVTHAPAIIGVDDGLFAGRPRRRTSTLELSTFNSGTEVDRGAVLRRHRRHVHRAQPGDQRLRQVRRRGAAHRRRHHVGRRLARRPRGHRRRRPTSPARRWPRRRSATPRTSPCGPGCAEQGYETDTSGGGDVVDHAAGERRHADRVPGRRPSTAPGCPSRGRPGSSTRAAATCSSTRPTCGPTASS